MFAANARWLLHDARRRFFDGVAVAASRRDDDDLDAAAGADDVWRRVLAQLAMPRWQRRQFFNETTLVADRGDILEVAVPSVDYIGFIERQFAAPLRSALDAVRPGTQLQFVVRDTTTSMAEAG